MGLRAKLASTFLILLFLAVFAISALQIDRTMTLMVDDLESSGDLLINQAFEQIRATLNSSRGDPARVLGRDNGLRTLLKSSLAFGRGVVYAQITGPGGGVIVSEPPHAASENEQPSEAFSVLQEKRASSWMGLARLYQLWGDRTYEMSRGFQIDGRPYGTITVGISTALTAAELHRSVRDIVFFALVAIVVGLLCAMVLGGMLLRPVVEISTSVEALTAGHEARRLRVGGRDELSSLAEKFNVLSQRINSDRTQWEHERGQLFDVFRSITDAVLLLDASGAVLFANGEACGRIGLPAGGVTEGKPLRLLLGKEHPLLRMVEAAYATGTEVHDVAMQLGDRGGPARLLVSISSLSHGPEPAGLLVVVRDLEPLRELENVVDHSGRLARLGALISGVAHQIRNPLNAMNLQLELLTQDAHKGRPIDARLESVRREIERLDEAVNALLRFMRPESLRMTEVAVNDLLAEVAAQVARPEIKIGYDFDPRVTHITADRALLGEALRNVASNAVESMPRGGTLTFRTMREDGVAEISIIDEGNGIPAEELDRIFQLYFTTKPGGSGLGLSLAARAIDLHRGTLDVQSEVGKGTTVKIRLAIDSEPNNLLSLSHRPV